MAHVSHKLSNSFEGALAGGGDPATSPLYVFGPLLRLIVVAGVASVTFGTTIWLTVLTVIVVSAMYRQVMSWIVDGSGGSGLSEEEFGSWAVKVNAAITFIEYTLTFLVSMSALVTFLSDRFPALDDSIFGIQYRSFIAIALSIITGSLINRGPKVAARAFGPATAAVLLLLWLMIFASIFRLGLQLPGFDLRAFAPEYLHFTLSGYARILALMTGVEIFANLVAAYDGTAKEKSRKAFGSLLIIMSTTSLTMIIVGPAILQLSDPTNEQVSVFTQTMDQLLPPWLSYLGTVVGVAVLLSACAASAQGVQNLALGLRYRHYVPGRLGQRNKQDVADRPVWLGVVLVSFCFLVLGTHEELYLALYAAGVFILLSMTGWAATKRLLREIREQPSMGRGASLAGTATAALLTTAATVIIFQERFTEGVWTYLFFVPALYVIFTYYRNRLGAPTSVEERLGLLTAEKRYLPEFLKEERDKINLSKILVPLDGSAEAEDSLPTARSLAHAYGANLTLALFGNNQPKTAGDGNSYLQQVASLLNADGIPTATAVIGGTGAEKINQVAQELGANLIVISSDGRFRLELLFSDNITQKLIQSTSTPVMLVRPTDDWRSRRSPMKRILVPLDGSSESEMVMPYVRLMATRFGSEVLLLSVPEGSESEEFGETIEKHLNNIVTSLSQDGIIARFLVTGSGPARTILSVSQSEGVDLVMMATHGRGGTERLKHVTLGSVAARVAQDTPCPLFLVPMRGQLS